MPAMCETNPIAEQFALSSKAKTIVEQQDGKTVAGIFNDFGDFECRYEGDSLWTFDGKLCDDHEIADHLTLLLVDLDEVLLRSVIEDFA